MQKKTQEQKTLEEAVELAKSLNNQEAASAFDPKEIQFTQLDVPVPSLYNEDGTVKSREENSVQVEKYIDVQSLYSLTGSIQLAMGIDPQVHRCVMTMESAKVILDKLGATYGCDEDGHFTCNVAVPGGDYTLYDCNEHLAVLRGAHFAITRSDPDLREYIERRLFATAANLEKLKHTPVEASEPVPIH